MLVGKFFLFFSLLHAVHPHLHINFYRTYWVSGYDHMQHDCLQVPAYTDGESDPRQIISYCMSEFPSKFKIKENNLEQKFTFEQLFKQNITSEQLNLWSAPSNLIEQYQSYLNGEKPSLSSEIFYNCTLPYFDPQCQYVFQAFKASHSSVEGIVHDYYRYNLYQPTLFFYMGRKEKLLVEN